MCDLGLHARATRRTGASRGSSSGSTDEPLIRTSKCRCGPKQWPVQPDVADDLALADGLRRSRPAKLRLVRRSRSTATPLCWMQV